MMQTLGDIYNHINDQLLDGELDSVSDVIQFLEECQQGIAAKHPIEAPVLTLTLTTPEIPIPVDMMRMDRVTVNDLPEDPKTVWGGVIYMPDYCTNKVAKLYYYKKPTPLDPGNLAQVPDIDARYLPAMAKYAAQMYYLADDDAEMREAFRAAFYNDMETVARTKVPVYVFKNLW